MGKKDKTGKREKGKKKSRKEHKEKGHKRRRHDSDTESSSQSSSSDSDGEQRRRSDKLAAKVAAHLHRSGGPDEAPRFVWTKKIEKELDMGKSVKDISAAQTRASQQERLDELDKVRKRQAEREEEKARREEELSLVQRLRAVQEAMESEAKEEEFYLKALLTKSEKRFGEGRPAPIDLIAKNLHFARQLGSDLREPWTYFDGLLMTDAQDLHQAICDYQEYDKYDDLHSKFWAALRVVADAELAEAQRRDAADRAALKRNTAAAAAAAAAEAAAEPEAKLHSDVELQIEAMMQGQTLSSLSAMQRDVEAALSGGLGDPQYWEAVLQRLQVQRAKAEVREVQAQIMQRHLSAQMTEQQAAAAAAAEGEAGEGPEGDLGEESDEESDEEDAEGGQDGEPGGQKVARERPRKRRAASEGPEATAKDGAGRGSPEPGDEGPEEPAEPMMGPEAPDEGPGPRMPARPGGPGGDDGEEADERTDGRFSPPPLSPADFAGMEVIHEEDDYRALQLLRQQVKLQASNTFKAAAAMASVPGTNNQFAAERAYQALLARGMGASHPMFRSADAPQVTDEAAFRQAMAAAAAGRAGPSSGMAAGMAPVQGDDPAALAMFRSVAERTMGSDDGDRAFGGEVALESRVYWWHDKYKPRKPKYFNRVHTGYEWTKYNQTHYDYDNPPPKVVQGYKFNIMYFDLIDKTKAPTYRVAPDPDCKDNSTILLVFSAGPPYEDIAFRIVNKEWEYNHKRGFKSTFDRGIMHLFINFKRTRYRR